MLANQRHLFDIPEEITYLNCAYQSPQLRQSTTTGIEQLRRKGQPWNITAEDFFAPAERLRESFARLIEASPDDIAIVPSLSYAMATAANNLPRAAGQHTVTVTEQFPSHMYAWMELNADDQATVKRIERPHNGDWTADVIEAIDGDCAVAALPESHWTDGYRLRLDEISQHCTKNGTALALDLTQSLGAIPFSVKKTEADFVAASVYKWLLGPAGLCMMYVNPRHHQGRPVELNWISRKDSQDFKGLTDYTDQFQPGARRFDAGGRANPTSLAVASSGLAQIHQWGPENISVYLSTLTARAANLAAQQGLKCTPLAHRSPHLMGIELPDDRLNRISKILIQNNIHASMRGNKLRISPFMYNDQDDINRLFVALSSAGNGISA